MGKLKDLVKCKHPNSRKTNALIKRIKKNKSRERSKQSGNVKLNLKGEKIMWFKEHLEPESTIYNSSQTIEIIEKYLARFKDELEQIQLKHSIGNRKNRQHASREDVINMTIKNETEEFHACGLEVPDLLNVEQFQLLKQWDGQLRYLPKFKMKRYSKKHLENLGNATSVSKVESPSCEQTMNFK